MSCSFIGISKPVSLGQGQGAEGRDERRNSGRKRPFRLVGALGGGRRLSVVAIGAAALAAHAAMALPGDKVTVGLEGVIAPHCGLNEGAAAEVPLTISDLLKPATYRLSYGFSCNTPFQYVIQSQNGALALDGAVGEGVVTRLPYDVGVYIPTDSGVIDDRCSSESIAAGRTTCALHDSGAAIAVDGKATLTVALPGAKQPAVMAAGRWGDRLTFVVSAKL